MTNSYALIREVDFKSQKSKLVLDTSNKNLEWGEDHPRAEIKPNDRVFILNEEDSPSDDKNITYQIMVFPANGSNPYEARYNTSKKTPLANIVVPLINQKLKRLQVPENKTATIYTDAYNSKEGETSKTLYHEDEIITIGTAHTVTMENGKTQAYHNVLVRENSLYGRVFIGRIPVEDVTIQNYIINDIKPFYEWNVGSTIAFQKKTGNLYFEENGVEKTISMEEDIQFQFYNDVDGGRQGNIVELKANAKEPYKDSDFTILKKDVILSERLIPYNSAYDLKVAHSESKTLAKEERPGSGPTPVLIKGKLPESEPVLVRPKVNLQIEEALKVLDDPSKLGTINCEPEGDHLVKKKSKLADQLICAERRMSGIHTRKLNDLYIEKLAPTLERLLNSPYGPTSETEKIHFLSQLLHETGGFGSMVEKKPSACWSELNQLAKDNKDAQICKRYSACVDGDNNYFSKPQMNRKGLVLNYTHKDKFRGRFPIQLTHCHNYLGFFKHLDLITKGKKEEAMRFETNFSAPGVKAGSYCTDEELQKLVGHSKNVNLDPLKVLLSPNPTKVLNSITSPCESKIGGLSSIEVMAQSALWYWKTNPNCKEKVKGLTMNDQTVIGPTKCINGGTTGLKDRKEYFNTLKSCMGIK